MCGDARFIPLQPTSKNPKKSAKAAPAELKRIIMGKIRSLTMAACLMGGLLLAGCLSRTSYHIVSTTEAPTQTSIIVEVPATSTIGNMQVWANHLENQFKGNGKPMRIDFYAEGAPTDQLIATYQAGSVRRVQQQRAYP